ncbi:5'/3'-nucleotidase SurE [uncultured Salinisphaera sp.]|uniref:5'/3'-nucleotidase SurE n=1 Tax=uncultured Salinisphaera sp. TaxID=359372 RepID=UPI0032B176EC|tara:strand:+ start:4901 stop:5704 length:804 start_codon:yes stop_codon:yes gene_type:complete
MPGETGRLRLARVLVTNDDGIDAPGLAVAEAIAAAVADEVWTVAPACDQSGRAQAITVREPLDVVAHGARRFAVTGTPADCVLLAAAHWLADTPPDLVIAGVNCGANISDTIVYSGTIGAALTAAHLGFNAVALSQAFRGPAAEADFAPARDHGRQIIEQLLMPGAPETTSARGAWSVNFPAARDARPIQGMGWARGAATGPVRPRAERVGSGRARFQLAFSRSASPVEAPDSDVAVLRSRRISVMPLTNERCDSAVFESATNRRES